MEVFGPKWANFDSFGAKMGQTGFFGEKAKMSLPYAYYALCKKPEQTYERIPRSKMYGRTNTHTDGRTEANLKVPTASGGGPITQNYFLVTF